MLHLLHLSTSPLERNIILSQAPWKGHDFKESDVAISSCHTTQWHDPPGPTASASKSATQNATTPCNVEPKGDMHEGSEERWRKIQKIDHTAPPYLKCICWESIQCVCLRQKKNSPPNQIRKLHPCPCIASWFPVGHHFQWYSWKWSKQPMQLCRSRCSEKNSLVPFALQSLFSRNDSFLPCVFQAALPATICSSMAFVAWLPAKEQNWSTHFIVLASQLAVSQAWNTCSNKQCVGSGWKV